MLKTMRRNLKSLSWALWAVIIAFIGFIFIQWGAGELTSDGDDSSLIRIGNRTIDGNTYYKMLMRSLENYRQQFKGNMNSSLIRQLRLPEQIVQNLVNAIVIQSEAENLNVTISNAELKKAIMDHPAFQKDGKFIGRQEYERILSYYQMSAKEFEADLKKDLVYEKLKDIVTAGLVIEPDLLQAEYRKENDKADLDLIRLNTDKIKEDIAVADQQLENFYQQNRDHFKSTEKRAGWVILYKLNDWKKGVSISEKELFDFYQKNKRSFQIPRKTKVARIFNKYEQATREDVLKKMEEYRKQITPENFSEKAKEWSQDNKAQDGGDWGYWDWKNFTSQEQNIIERLNEKEISTPVDTGDGFVILFVTEKVSEKQETYEEARVRIKMNLENEQAGRRLMAKIQKDYEKIKNEKEIKNSAEKLGLPVKETISVSNGQPIPGLDEMGYLSGKFFEIDLNQISTPFEMPDGMAIVQLRKIVKSEVLPFEQAIAEVRKGLVISLKLDRLFIQARDLIKKMNAANDQKEMEEMLKKENLTLESIEYRRGNRLSSLGTLKGLDDIVFSMVENQIATPLRFKNEIAVIKIKTKKLSTENDFSSNRVTFLNKKLNEMKNTQFGAYVLKKRQNYPIRVNNDLLEKIIDSVMSRF